MPDESARGAGWNVNSLYAHLDSKIDAVEEKILIKIAEADSRYEHQFKSLQDASALAEHHADQWRVNANEWRAAMTDREKAFMSRPEVERALQAVDAKLGAIKEFVDKVAGSQSNAGTAWHYLMVVVGLVLNAGTLLYLIIKGH